MSAMTHRERAEAIADTPCPMRQVFVDLLVAAFDEVDAEARAEATVDERERGKARATNLAHTGRIPLAAVLELMPGWMSDEEVTAQGPIVGLDGSKRWLPTADMPGKLDLTKEAIIPIKAKPCDCGGAKTGTPHSSWCSAGP